MQRDKIIEYAKSLVETTINMHTNGLLGNEKMSTFIKRNIKGKITHEDYDKILHLYSRHLSKEGYEIKKDINHFDIIDYNSNEYKYYCDEISNNSQFEL